MKSKLNIDWSNVTWVDLRQPIKSGLAITLLLKAKRFQTVPQDIELQASIWQALNPSRNRPFTYLSKEYANDVGKEQ